VNAAQKLFDDAFRAYPGSAEWERQQREAEVRDQKIAERFTALWNDPEVLSEVVTDDLPALMYRRKGRNGNYPARDQFTGIAALTALRDGDHAEFGRLVHAAMVSAVQAKAEQQIDDETPDPEFDL
jgi:hypothetical protein